MEPMGLAAQQMPDNIHPWLRFGRPGAVFNLYSERYLRISGKQYMCPRLPDWVPLDQAGVGDRVRAVLRSRYYIDDGHIDHNDWVNFFNIWQPICRELCLEFLCTAQFKEKGVSSARDRSFLTFRLGGEDRSMSYRDIAISLGIYSEDEYTSDYFDDFLISGARIGRLTSTPWSQLSTTPYVTSLNKITDVSDMNLRVIQRFLAHTITQRDENNERPNLQDMWYMERFKINHMINIPYCLTWYLVKKAAGRQENSPICGGHYISCFARHFGVNFQRLTMVRDPHLTVGEAMYFTIKVVKKVGNSFVLWPEAEEALHPHQTDDGPSHMEEDVREEEQVHTQEHGQNDPLTSILRGIESLQFSNNAFRADFNDFRDGMEYRMGNLEYRTDWIAGNVSWMAEQQGHHTTQSQPLYQWGTQEARQHPPPVYDHQAALEEAQRRHQEEYDRNLQQEWRIREEPADWTAWPSEEEMQRRQEDQYRYSGFWPFGPDH